MSLTKDEVLKQSRGAFSQWEETWRKHAKINGEIYKAKGIPLPSLQFKGAGKTVILCAYAPSLEDQIKTIKENLNENIEIMCVDKAMGSLIDNGIIPNYVLSCDAGIDYEKWCKPYIEQTKDITLISNINANIEWTQNWKGDISFFVNKDNIESEKIFCDISGCPDQIPAGSNVGNSLVIYATHILKYDEYLLVGYDFCWGQEDNYYAFNDSVKRYWMKHITLIDNIGRLVHTSNNLIFSCRWLVDFYIKVIVTSGIKMYNCSGKGVLSAVPMVDLKRRMLKAKGRKLSAMEKSKIIQAHMKNMIIGADDPQKHDKLKSCLGTLAVNAIKIEYVDKEVLEWLN